MITVRDLIKHLETMPPDMEVWEFSDDGDEYWPVSALPGIFPVTKPQYYLNPRGGAAYTGEWVGDLQKGVLVL